jgi:7-cyano-7-deazaguanine synthase
MYTANGKRLGRHKRQLCAPVDYLDVFPENPAAGGSIGPLVTLANHRAEPTTEWVEKKVLADQQPYACGSWTIVHNGTIANDSELRTGSLSTSIDSAAIVEALAEEEGRMQTPGLTFSNVIRRLKGSFAILARNRDEPDVLYAALNYKPIWHVETEHGVLFGSSESFFNRYARPKALTPYSIYRFQVSKVGSVTSTRESLRPRKLAPNRSLVVCSGGLDSTVAAAICVARGEHTHLLHFTYGCRAETKELDAVAAIAERLGVPYTVRDMSIYNAQDSRLLDADSAVAGGEAGAEFAHEWVPARNLVMLSLAVAYAEANGFNRVVLGNNLEEAGAYPDNEPEFIDRFNKLLPYAVADGVDVQIAMPVGNLMKHEIVRKGLDVNAPLDLTWSCYRNGEKHCGTCGPCFMRRTAFQINGATEVIPYERATA